jgi:hypothetical protein
MPYLKITQIGFVVLTLLSVGLVGFGLNQVLKRHFLAIRIQVMRNYYLGIGIWIALLSILSLTGFTTDFDSMPPKFAVVILIPLITFIFLWRNKTVKLILKEIPLSWLTYLQSFRVVVEIFLWLLFLAEIAPIQMTFEGRNHDILVGLSAPIAAVLFLRKGKLNKKAMMVWNFLGLALLVNIVTIALLSTPTPLRVFMNDPANTIVAEFPIVFLPGVLVPLAYYLHLLSLQKLLKED